MTKYCKGFCDKFPHFWRYVSGFKYCKVCETFMKPEEGTTVQCPCCHGQMRLKHRVSTKAKRLAYSEAVIRY